MRHVYPTSPETIKVINGHAQQIADEMDVIDKYIYAIQAGTQTDPFAKFKALYAAAIRAGCDVSHWDNALQAIRERYAMRSGELSIGNETAKLMKESADVAAAALDGKPLHQQLTEVSQTIAQAEVLKASLIKAINDSHEVPMYNGKPYDVSRRA